MPRHRLQPALLVEGCGLPGAWEEGGAGLNAANIPWDCNADGHLFMAGTDVCIHCGAKVVTTAASGGFFTHTTSSAKAFPDVDAVLDGMAAVQRAQELLDEGHGPPDAIRALAEQRAQQLDVQVVFSRTLADSGDLRWRVMVRTRRGEVTASPRLSQEQMVAMAIDSDEWRIEGWKNALREVGLL